MNAHLLLKRTLIAYLLLAACLLLAAPVAASWPDDPLVNVPLCTNGDTQRYAKSVADCAGGVVTAWLDDRGVDSCAVYVQRINVSGVIQWQTNGIAATVGVVANEPVITADGTGGAIVAWRQWINGGPQMSIAAQRVSGSGIRQWAPGGVVLGTPPNFQFQSGQVITSDGAGGAIVA